MVESFHGEELFRSEPLVCIVSQDQRFHMESYIIIIHNLGSKDVQFVLSQGRWSFVTIAAS